MNILPQLLTDVSTVQNAPLGARYVDLIDGNVYRYFQAKEIIAKGACVTPKVLGDGDADASTGKELKDGAVTFTSSQVGALVSINVGTNSINDAPNKITALLGSGASNYFSLETAWSADLTTGEDYIISHPYMVEECDAVGESPVGVAMVAMADGEYGWIQVKGRGHALIDGTAKAVTFGQPLVTSTTAGSLKGLEATADSLAADSLEAATSKITALSISALVQRIPVIINCE